jgi:hypothetical protein
MPEAAEPVATEESSDRELSLRETLEAARDEVMSRQQEAEPPEPEPKTAPAEEGRPRDDRGRFVSGAPKADETPPVAVEPTSTPSSDGVAPAAAAPPTQEFIPAPQSWTNAEKALWKDVPPAVRQAIARREADVHKEFTRRDNDLTFAREFQRISQPYEPVLRQLGATPLQAVQSLMQSLWTLTTADPVTRGQFIQNLARQYGAQIPAQGQTAQQPQLPPDMQHYFAQQNQLNRQLQSQVQSLIQERQSAEQARLTAEIQTFQSDPANKFFTHVADDMIRLLEKGAADSLKEAYDLAVLRRPDLREQLFTVPAQQQQQRQAKTQAARAKSGSVKGGPGTAGEIPFKSDGSLRGDLQAAFREVTGRE